MRPPSISDAAGGEFINQVRAARRFGMDLNPEAPEKLAREVVFLAQDCSEPWALRDETLDVVFTSNFFEHLPANEGLRRTLDQAFRCLKPGGRLICLGPNIKFLPGSYWDFWNHYLPLSEGLRLRDSQSNARSTVPSLQHVAGVTKPKSPGLSTAGLLLDCKDASFSLNSSAPGGPSL